jgi:hypothetical protein
MLSSMEQSLEPFKRIGLQQLQILVFLLDEDRPKKMRGVWNCKAFFEWLKLEATTSQEKSVLNSKRSLVKRGLLTKGAGGYSVPWFVRRHQSALKEALEWYVATLEDTSASYQKTLDKSVENNIVEHLKLHQRQPQAQAVLECLLRGLQSTIGKELKAKRKAERKENYQIRQESDLDNLKLTHPDLYTVLTTAHKNDTDTDLNLTIMFNALDFPRNFGVAVLVAATYESRDYRQYTVPNPAWTKIGLFDENNKPTRKAVAVGICLRDLAHALDVDI